MADTQEDFAALDAILGEFGQNEAPKDAVAIEGDAAAVTTGSELPAEVSDRLAALENWKASADHDAAMERQRQDIDSAVTYVREKVNAPTDKWIRGRLLGEYHSDPIFADAFNNRGKNPMAWKAALDRARNAMREETTMTIDSEVTADRTAIEQAVLGSRSAGGDLAAGDVPRHNGNDADYRQKIHDRFGYWPNF